MEFDKSRVYTAVNADELKVGSKVMVANYLESLKDQVETNSYPSYVVEISQIMGTSSTNRFKVGNKTFNLAYLVSEPEEKKLKWTDLKVGDAITKGMRTALVTVIDKEDTRGLHVYAGHEWFSDTDLEEYEKVKETNDD